MRKKSWVAIYEDLEIIFENQWSFSGSSIENLYINGKIKTSNSKSLDGGIKGMLGTRLSTNLTVRGKNHLIEVRAGSKWYLLALGCHIYVNGKLIGGDVNSKLLFA